MLNEKANRRRGPRAALGLLVALLLALGAAGHALSSTPSASTGPDKSSPSSSSVLAPQQLSGTSAAPSGGGTSGGTAGGGSFGVTVGRADTLYPGLPRMLPVTYTNPNSFDILITSYSVSVSVQTWNRAPCSVSNLQVPGTVSLNPGMLVARTSSVSTTVPIKLLATAPDGCRRATFSITVSATAVRK